MYHKQLALGATFIQDEWGWMRAESFTQPEGERQQARQSVGFADISHIGKLALKGNDVMRTTKEWYSYPDAVKPGRVLASGSGAMSDALCCVLAKDEVVLLVDPAATEAVHGYMVGKTQTCFHVTDISSILGGLYLIGPRSGDVLSKLAELDVNPESLPNLAVAQAPLLHVQSMILKLDLDGLLGYQIYFERAYGEYLWEALMNAGEEFQIATIGRSAMKLLGWRWS